jgi:hypothetical protein
MNQVVTRNYLRWKQILIRCRPTCMTFSEVQANRGKLDRSGMERIGGRRQWRLRPADDADGALMKENGVAHTC